METKVLNYRIIITPEKFKGKIVYNALSPALGVADFGDTIEEAKEHIQGAIECFIEALVKDHRPIPAPDADDPEYTITTTSVSLPPNYKPTFI